MVLTLAKTQAVADLAEFLRDFLPGKPHPFADQSVSFVGSARRLGLEQYWPNGSKLSSVRSLLASTLDREPKKFCSLVLDVVRRGIGYRQNSQPISREEIATLSELLRKVGFRIRDLDEDAFLAALPSRREARSAANVRHKPVSVDRRSLVRLGAKLEEIAAMAPTVRGLSFESFLGDLFELFGLAKRSAFRLRGEQIDGSCEVASNTYLVEAKWHSTRIGQNDLLVLSGKVGGKAEWARGLHISFSGYTTDGLSAYGHGKQANLICMDRDCLRVVLRGDIDLGVLIQAKARRAAEENVAFVPAAEFVRGAEGG